MKTKSLKFWENILMQPGDEHHFVGWSRISHMKRFEKIAEVGDFEGKTIMDVGCGLGGFFDFLCERGIRCGYEGIDITPGMIDMARDRHPQIAENFFVWDILEMPLNRKYDYVVANGVLNLKFEGAPNVEMTLRLLGEMFRIAEIGAVATMTSSLTMKPNSDTFYYDPVEILVGSLKLTKNIRLDHTYLPHDFAIFLYKRDLYQQ
jgi:ubiquinone/menaquinone biosynthesis C-methylase UbiE